MLFHLNVIKHTISSLRIQHLFHTHTYEYSPSIYLYLFSPLQVDPKVAFPRRAHPKVSTHKNITKKMKEKEKKSQKRRKTLVEWVRNFQGYGEGNQDGGKRMCHK